MGRPMQRMKLRKILAGVGRPDPDLEEAINSAPLIPVSKEQLAKNGWTSCEGHKFVIVGHKPKAYRTPSAKASKVRHSYNMALQGWGMVKGRRQGLTIGNPKQDREVGRQGCHVTHFV